MTVTPLYGVMRLSPGAAPVLESRGQLHRERASAVNALAMAKRSEPGITFILMAVVPAASVLTWNGERFDFPGMGHAPLVSAGDVDDRE